MQCADFEWFKMNNTIRPMQYWIKMEFAIQLAVTKINKNESKMC